MQAVVFNKPFEMALTDYPLRNLQPQEICVQIEACGVCGTDHHIYAGEAPASPPVILGHEFVGRVVETGASVVDFKSDDHVAIDPNIPCRTCSFCRAGKIHLCTNLKALGVNLNGGFAEYAIVPAGQAYGLPDDFPAETAAFAEPLSCCLHGIQQAAINTGDAVAIVGGGTIGLLMLQLVRLAGAAMTLLMEPVAEKREIAAGLGADHVLDPASDALFEEVNEITNGGADVVIECAGNSKAVSCAVKLAKRGGRIVLFGLAGKSDCVNLNLQDFFHRELTLKGSLLNPFTFQTAIQLLTSNKISTEPLKVKPLELSQIADFFSQLKNSQILKYQIIPN
ncbi:MAG: zinc-dependent alcohol dehydrogenase family protein [bacterium]